MSANCAVLALAESGRLPTPIPLEFWPLDRINEVRERANHWPGRGSGGHRAVASPEVVMSDVPQQEAHRRPHTPPMADPFMEFDLSAEIHRLHAETTWNTGRNARTLVKYDDFRVVLMALAADARMPEHKAEGRISIHVLSGHIQLRASGRTFSLRSGGLLALDHGVSHDVHALEESALLLTIAWPGRG